MQCLKTYISQITIDEWSLGSLPKFTG